MRIHKTHTFRTVKPEDMGRFPIRFTEVTTTWVGRRIKLPPMDDRASPEQYAGVALWLFDLPYTSVLTDRYALALIDLRDIKGVPAAVKDKPSRTHELCFMAVNPDTTDEMWESGRYRVLTPVNYAEQFTARHPSAAVWVAERCAEAFVQGRFPVEPQGISGARKLFRGNVDEWETQAGRVFDSRGPNHPTKWHNQPDGYKPDDE